jgi:septal ring factor EnvC (AmiA/AmiB activator)
MQIAYIMPNEDDKIRVNGRVSRELYVDISTYYANITTAINDALELLRQEKTGQLHKDCGRNIQNDASSIQAQLEATHMQLEAFRMQIDAANTQIEFLKEQIGVKDSLIEKQAFHIQSLIQENSRLNVKLLPENTEKKVKSWWRFW